MIPFMPKDPKLAFAYVPFQKFENIYCASKALKSGTVFQDLDIPFECYKDNPIMSPYKSKMCK